MTKVIRYSAPMWFVCLLFIAGGCRSSHKFAVEKTRPLPEAGAGEQRFSSYEPARGYSELAPGVLNRPFFGAAGPPGYRIELRDLFVAPGRKGQRLSLPGAAFLEVRDGSAVILVGDKRQELPIGATVSVNQGQSFDIEATSQQPLVIRVALLQAQ